MTIGVRLCADKHWVIQAIIGTEQQMAALIHYLFAVLPLPYSSILDPMLDDALFSGRFTEDPGDKSAGFGVTYQYNRLLHLTPPT